MSQKPNVTATSIAKKANVDPQKLSDHQKQFLIARAGTGSDADAARMIHINPDTVNTWKRRSREGDGSFMAAYDVALKVIDEKLEAVTNFDRDTYVEDNLVEPAFQRLKEILDLEVDPDTEAQMVAQIRQTATTILKSRGYLKDDPELALSIPVIIADHLKSGDAAYQPRFRRVGNVEVETSSPPQPSTEP